MEKSQNTALLYSLEDYIGAFKILDALPYSAIRPEHVKPFVDNENYLLSTIELAKQEYLYKGLCPKLNTNPCLSRTGSN